MSIDSAAPSRETTRGTTVEMMMILRSCFALIFGYALLLCGRSAAAADPIAQRIVSTAPSLTETLFALGLGSHVVGVSQYCEWPPEVKALPKVGSYVQPNAEAIVRLRPDLVLLEHASNEVSNRLNAVHVRFVEVPHGSLEDTYAAVGVIAQASGVADRGRVLVEKMRSGLAEVQARAAKGPRVRVLMIVDRRPGLLADIIAVGPNNYENELLEIAGGANVLAHAGVMTYPRISLETVLRENPDVIVDLTDAHDSDSEHHAERVADQLLWGKEQSLKAARSGHIFIADSALFLVPGPRVVDAAARLYTALHASSTK